MEARRRVLDSCLEEVLAGPPQLRQAPAFLAFLQPHRPPATDPSEAQPLPGFGGSLRLLTGAATACKGFHQRWQQLLLRQPPTSKQTQCAVCILLLAMLSWSKRIRWLQQQKQQQQQQPATRGHLL